MAACRCDPTQLRETGPHAGTPHRPRVYRMVLRVAGQEVGARLVLHCRRCGAWWGGE